MSERERTRPRPSRGGDATPEEDISREALRERARRLLDVGDAVIDRALSGDSRQFLDSNLQQGGQ